MELEIEEFSIRQMTGSFRNARPFIWTFKRETAYRGVHTVTARVTDADGQLVFQDIVAVHIK